MTNLADQFRFALEAAPIGMLVVDSSGMITFANAHVERLFGYRRGELVGATLETLVPLRSRERHTDFRKHFLGAPQARAMGAGRDLFGLRSDGSEIPVEIALNPITTVEGDFVLGSIIDITERKRSEEQFRLALEAAPTGMLMVDSDGCISLVNAQIENLFGYTRAELIGMKVENLVPHRYRQAHPDYRTAFFRNPETRAMGGDRELYALRKDGTEVPVEIGLNPLHTSSGHFVLSSIVDISERKRTVQQLSERTEALAATLQEREVLLQEIHHRVKNNLQIIASLINMQMRKLDAAPSRAILNECKTRVDTIALIHEKLYQSRDFTNVSFGNYARELVASIMQASGTSFARLALVFEIDDIFLPVDQAIPCGLIVNELFTNTLKHAFPQDRTGTVRISMKPIGDSTLRLAVADDGVGASDHVVNAKRDSIGLLLVASLADQLNGQFQMINGDTGTIAGVEFPWKSVTTRSDLTGPQVDAVTAH